MEKRSAVYNVGSGETLVKNTDSEGYITLRSLRPSNLLITGQSGKVYHFPQAGSEVKVLKMDVTDFLKKRSPKPCCGGTASKYFELVGE
jgi:hypothetical protein